MKIKISFLFNVAIELYMHFNLFGSLTRDDPEEARYYANPKKTAMTLFHVVRLLNMASIKYSE